MNALQSKWPGPHGAIYAVLRSTRCNLGGAMNALQSKWPGPHGAIYAMHSNAKQCLATHTTAEQCAATHRTPPQRRNGVLGRCDLFGPSQARTK